jgi:hypothetical protein
MRARFLVLPLAMTLASGVAMMPLMHPAQAAIDISINIAPPPLPVYEQPPLPGPGYMWSPGYWAYDPADGYYWVPGTWVEPPEVGLLWTPGYWAFVNGAYAWNGGYWGPTVGFYGGVDYGFGYTGRGFYGGRWDHGHFAYNRAAWNVGNAHVTNVYNQTFERNTNANRVSFNGGNGGVNVRPSAEEERARHEHHVQATAMQTRQIEAARQDPQLRASANHGRPAIAATARPGDFKAHPVAATNAADPNIGKRNAAQERRENNAAVKPNAAPAERNAATPGATRPGERNAATPNAMRPGEEHRNAERPNANPAERKTMVKPNAAPAERNTMTKPTQTRPQVERRAAPENRPENRSVMHPPRSNAERPAVAHPAARPPVHPEPGARPAEAHRPIAAPHTAAPHPAARPAPQHEEKKQP